MTSKSSVHSYESVLMKFFVRLAIMATVAFAQTPAKIPDVPAKIPDVYDSVTVTAKQDEPTVERRTSEVFSKTLFSRDDQIFHVLDAGISAGQHEGGGKSVEIRRFGLNLDHGGVSGGLKVLVDGVGQN